MNQNENRRRNPSGSQDLRRPVNAQPSGRPAVSRRRRRPRKPPVNPLLICAVIVFVLGFLLGFLVRGAFLPDAGEPAPSTEPSQTSPSTEPTQTSAPAGETTAPTEPQVMIGPDDWRLTLVNARNPLTSDPDIELADIPNDYEIDARVYDDFAAMIGAMEAEGLHPVIRSGFRSMSDQQVLFDNKVNELKEEGYSDLEAREKAGTIVAVPGTSEHQLGLAVDIVDDSYWSLDEKQESTPVQQWLMEHCWEYGFILRYPNEKSEITGIIYEPWHYRYVGREVALDMKEQDMCLEEYLVYLEQKA